MKSLGLERTSIPLYVQLEQIIRSKIMIGEFLPGDQIPTEKELAETYQVSYITARRGVVDLVRQGLLVRRQGKGTFVRGGVTSKRNILTLHVRGDIKDVVPESVALETVKVLEIARVVGPLRITRALNLPDDEKIYRIRRTRSDKGSSPNESVTISYIRNYVPQEIGERINKKDLLTNPMLDVLRYKLGLPLTTGVQYLEATLADYEIASALSVGISSPVFYLETTVFAEGGQVVEFSQTFYRADQCRYTLKLDLTNQKAYT